jgi:hypothetical protein
MRRIFWGFCRNWFLIDPFHYLSSRSDFGFEFAEIFVIKNDSPTWRVGESATLRLGESGSRQLSDSASRGVDDLPTRRVGESAFECLKEKPRRFGESATPRLGESGSR